MPIAKGILAKSRTSGAARLYAAHNRVISAELDLERAVRINQGLKGVRVSRLAREQAVQRVRMRARRLILAERQLVQVGGRRF